MKRSVIILIIAVVIVVGLSFGSLYYYKFFGPKYEDARREVFESTRSYNQAKIQELAKYKLEYERSKDKQEKEALAFTIRHRFADYNDSKLDYQLKPFLNEIRGY